MNLKKQIEHVLDTIPDPEIGISLTALGLIYDVTVEGANVRILMTLTTIGCPLFDQIAGPIREKVGALKGVTNIDIDLTFDPPWNPDMMSEEAKIQLGFA